MFSDSYSRRCEDEEYLQLGFDAAWEEDQLRVMEWLVGTFTRQPFAGSHAARLGQPQGNVFEVAWRRHVVRASREMLEWLELTFGSVSSVIRAKRNYDCFRWLQFTSVAAMEWLLTAANPSITHKGAILAAICGCREDPAFPAAAARLLGIRLDYRRSKPNFSERPPRAIGSAWSPGS
jgi:hypothetical protein